MKCKSTCINLVFCVLLFFGILQFMNYVSASATIIVTSGESIQTAINNAQVGATIIIKKGIYREYPIFVNKSITLLGENREETIIDGDGSAYLIINVLADNVKIRNITVQNTAGGTFPPVQVGIQITDVQRAEVSDCIVKNCAKNLRIGGSQNVKISRNNITQALPLGYGIHLDSGSVNNLLINNYIVKNPTGTIGIRVESTAINNVIYHNNFIDNELDLAGGANNRWDNGYPSGGNYWSKHISNDFKSGIYQNETGSDGICDGKYNFDNYPLMGPIHAFWAGNWGEDYYVSISSNSTEILNFQFNNSTCTLQFDAIGSAPQYGFSRMIVQKGLLWVEEGEQWLVEINGATTSPNIREDQFHTYIYVNYSHSTTKIKITGTRAIPEITMPSLITIVLTIIGLQLILKKKLKFRKI